MTGTIQITTTSFDVAGNPDLQDLIARGFTVRANPEGRKLSEAEVAALMGADTVGLIAGTEPLTDAVMAAAPRLRTIARVGSGLDTVDLAAARSRGIAVTITPDAPVAAVAELTIALMLAALRHIPFSDRQLREGRWASEQGALLGAATVGLIGFGRIGRAVARLAGAFGSQVIAHDPLLTTGTEEDGVALVDLDTLLARATVISLHAPLTADSRHLIDAGRIAGMGRGSVLVNTARGALVDDQAVNDALDSGHLAAAALDVFEAEPYRGVLTGQPRAVLTAHMGSRARETRRAMELEAGANLKTVLLDAAR